MSHSAPDSHEDSKNSLDNSEFHRLIAEHQAAIYSHIFALLPQPEDASDVFQNTRLALLRKSAQFTPGTNFRAWAGQIAKYEVFNYRRICQIEKTVNHAIELSEGDENFASSMQSLSGIGRELKQLQLDGR